MVRTKADGVKAAGAKAMRKAPPSAPTRTVKTGSSSSKSYYSGRNRLQKLETPEWQKPITNFFASTPGEGKESNDQNLPESDESGNSKAPLENPSPDEDSC